MHTLLLRSLRCRLEYRCWHLLILILEARTMAIKVGDPRRETAHNEAVALVSDLASYLSLHQADILSMATDATVPDGSPSDSEEGGVPTPSPFTTVPASSACGS